MMKNVLIVGDRPVYRMGIKTLVESANYRVSGEAESAEEGWLLASELRPDIVMIDLSQRHSQGLMLIRRIAGKLNARIIALSAFSGSLLALRAIRAGAFGFVIRESKTVVILKCLNAVSGGDTYIDDSVLSENHGSNACVPDKYERLTKAERGVFRLLADGRAQKDIAEKLGIGMNTVKTHRKNIYKKIEIKNKSELIKFARELENIYS